MQESIMEQLWSTSHISGGNATYVEELYETYLHDPNAVPEEWRSYFEKLPRVEGVISQDTPHSEIREQFAALGKQRVRTVAGAGSADLEHERKQIKVINLINAYRFRGHQKAKLDPLALMVRAPVADLELQFHGLTPADLDVIFHTGGLFIGK